MSDSEGYTALADAETGETPKNDMPGYTAAAPAPRRSLGRRLRWPLLIGGPLIVAIAILIFWLNGGRYVGTDDAYVQAARVDVSSNVPGRVVEVDVHDNQRVAFGQQLFRLDSKPYDTAAAEAAAQLAAARANLTGQEATVGERKAELAQASATFDYQTKELARQKTLAGAGVSSQQQLSAQSHAVDAAKAKLDAAKQALANAVAVLGGQEAASGGSPAVRQAQAALQRAQLNQSYGIVNAPQAGTVTKVDQLQVGNYINAAQPLFSLVADRMWIEANFKEDQLAHMKVGQHVTVQVDALPGVKITGFVESLSPGTGSSFALLPAENATGNWVKVVQRLPVRIALDPLPRGAQLHAGLSAKVSVDTEQKRHLFGAH
jgi:membrane fusion protein (multidrug efflux system)